MTLLLLTSCFPRLDPREERFSDDSGTTALVEVRCDDDADDDGDGDVDCADSDCRDAPACEDADTDADSDSDADTDTDTDTDTLPDTETECGDGLDDDGDGDVDCDDRDCVDECVVCWDTELEGALGFEIAEGTAAGDDASGSCGGSGDPDTLLHWTAPAAGVYTFDTVGSAVDTLLWVTSDTCGGDELACDDDTFGTSSQVGVSLSEGEDVVIGVEASGGWVLSAWEGECPQYSIGAELGVVGSTSSATESYTSSCGDVEAAISLRWVAPSSGTWSFSTFGSGFDTILSLQDTSCDGEELACDDDASTLDLSSTATTFLAAGDVVAILVGGYEGATGDYEINISD